MKRATALNSHYRKARLNFATEILKKRQVGGTKWCTQTRKIFASTAQMDSHITGPTRRSTLDNFETAGVDGRVMIYTAFSSFRTAVAVHVRGAMDSHKNCWVLIFSLLPLVAENYPQSYTLQQNNSPIHTPWRQKHSWTSMYLRFRRGQVSALILTPYKIFREYWCTEYKDFRLFESTKSLLDVILSAWDDISKMNCYASLIRFQVIKVQYSPRNEMRCNFELVRKDRISEGVASCTIEFRAK